MYAAQDHVHKPRSMKQLPRSGRHWRVLTIILGMILSQLAPGGLLVYRGGLLPLDVSGPTAAHAAGVWYVDINNASASDANPCASSSSPCKTIGGALGKAAAGDTIDVNPGTYDEHLSIAINVTLVGASPRSTFIDGTNSGTVITVNGGTTVTIQNVTIQHGNPPGGVGGGIASSGSLTVLNSTITNNTANGVANIVSYGGGGIAVQGGSATIRGSTIENNTTNAFGAGVDVFGGATATVVNSTIANNTDSAGGGGDGIITWGGASLSVVNSTIANNPGSSVGGGGIYNYGTTQLKNTLLAGNPGNCRNDAAQGQGTMTDSGYNLEDQATCGFSAATSKTSTNPLLATTSPANNAGPTDTIALQSGSPAIGAGSCTDISGTPVTTDQRGVSRPTTACTIGAFEVINDTWANALNLNQPSGSYQVNQTVSQHIDLPTQERWYKFPVTPGSQVHVSYQGDPGATVSLHSDMQAAYNALTTPTNAAVESARDAASGFLPQGYLPQGYLPQGYLPQGYLPQGYLPQGYLPQGYLPQGYLPQGYLPQGYLPQGYLPQGYLPQGYLPQGYLPQGYLPGPYSGAVWDSLLAISATPNSSVQTIDHNTWNSFGYFYVRVVGTADSTTPFSLTVTETGGVCAGVTTISATPPSTIPSGLKTLILWDSTRITGSTSDISTLSTKLGQLATRSDVQGTVIDLSQIPGIDGNGSAQSQADNNPACPTAKNIVANDIKSVVQAYHAQNSGLQYIVLVGDDHSIPFFRYPDEAGLAPENQYFPPVADSSPSQAGLRDNFVLGQDDYGASVDLPRGDHALPIPDLAVGRLVSTAAEVSHMLDVYTAANGTITPGSSLVTGYDFVADAACNAEADLAAGVGATPDTLIQSQTGTTPPSTCPTSSAAWNANELRQKLLGSRHDVVFLAGHFSAGGLEASDYSTNLFASEVASAPIDFTNSLFLVLGCHGGYNIPGGDAVANLSPSPNWPEAFAEKGATLLAATGYAYGDTVLTEYGEHLFDNYLHQLRLGSGPVAVGQAEVAAKKEYLASHADLGGVDEKTLLETTLYGLPMMGVNLPAGRIPQPSTSSIVSGVQTVTTGPGVGLQLGVGQTSGGSSTIDVQPTLTMNSVPLTNSADGSTVTAKYLSGRDGTAAHPLDPISPQQLDNVHVPGQILRGVGFWGGTYTDTTGITPLTTAPATENSVGHPSFFSTVLYPTQVWTANYLDAISGGVEKLVTTPAQYRSATNSDGSLSTSGTLRQFSDLQFRLYYLPSGWTTNSTTSAAAVGAASNIAGVSATSNSSGVTFSVRVLSSPAVGTQDVWVTYTDPGAPGTWTSIDLTQSSTDPTLWQATANLPSDIQFMVQAVNGAGLVSLSTNSGAYYSIGSPPPVSALTATSITVQPATSTPTGYQQTASFTVSLSSGGGALQGQQVALQLGDQEFFKDTDPSGNASFTVPLDQPPGSYSLNASFAGNATYAASQAQPASFQISPGPTNLTLSTSSATQVYGNPSGVVATLTDAAGNPHPLAQRSVLFTASDTNGHSYQTSVITDDLGHAQLGTVPLPVGTYTLSASYGGQIASGQVNESDPNYQSSSASGSLTITARPITITADAKTKVYGTADPALTYKITSGSLVGADNFSGSLTRVGGESVGSYAIQKGTLTAGSNYALTFNGASLSITPAALSITAGSPSMVYGAPVPTITPSYSGFVNGDTASSLTAPPACSTTATSSSPVGTYATSCQNANDPNYTISYVGGTLTVNRAGTAVTASGTNATYGQTSASLSARVTASSPSTASVNEGSVTFQLSQSGANVGSPVTANVSNGAASAPYSLPTGAVGTYTINATYNPAATAPNFTGSSSTGTVAVQYLPATSNGVANSCNGDLEHAILKPVNADGSSVFKQGSTVPLKFRVCDVNGHSVGPTATASTVVTSFTLVQAVGNCGTCSVDEPIDSTTPDTAFRWDSTGQQWIFNLSTKNLVSGTTYSYDIALNDGTHIDFSFATK